MTKVDSSSFLLCSFSETVPSSSLLLLMLLPYLYSNSLIVVYVELLLRITSTSSLYSAFHLEVNIFQMFLYPLNLVNSVKKYSEPCRWGHSSLSQKKKFMINLLCLLVSLVLTSSTLFYLHTPHWAIPVLFLFIPFPLYLYYIYIAGGGDTVNRKWQGSVTSDY